MASLYGWTMQLVPLRLEAETTEEPGPRFHATNVDGSATTAELGPLVVTFIPSESGVEWSVANRGDWSVAVRSVALVYRMADVVPPLRMFRNGYQSWSPTAVAIFGVDEDPSTRADFPFLQAVHHADQRQARPGELRSEWVTVVDDAGLTPPVLLGFDGGDRHDGTLRLAPDLSTGDEALIVMRAEAFLGDAVLHPGVMRPLHNLIIDQGDNRQAPDLLEAWATRVGAANRARVDADFQVGWCSWYQYFHDVTEGDIRSNLARADQWPFDVFQIDDGYQVAIGDWLETNDRFPSDLAGLAQAIGRSGYTPGLWLAPFLVAPDSEVARAHPDWIARHQVAGADAGPLRTWWNPSWGGGEDGFMYGLDTTHPGVQDHLEALAASVVEAGFPYLKLDFTFSPSVDGAYADPTCTPAERVRAGFAAIRRGAGDDAFLLGCGVPLANVVGLVDANRIGPDVAPVWSLDPSDEVVPGYLGTQPATGHAFTNTLTRSFMHRKLWLNDPDCVMLRREDTALSSDQIDAWARAVGVSGGMVLVSDNLDLLDHPARELLDEVIATGRAGDEAARQGRSARCPDLMDRANPKLLESAGGALTARDQLGPLP